MRTTAAHPAVSGRHERRLRYRSAGDRKRLLRRLGARLLAVVYLVGVGSLILVGMAFSGGGGVVAGLIFGRRIARTYRRLRAYGEQTAEQMLARDPRKPVVFLRAFDDDAADLKVDTRWSVRRNWAENSFVNEEHLEEVVARQMWRFGPVFALGRPGALEHPLGATRSSVSDDCWRAEITTRMEEARLIVLVLGQGRGLAWEIEALARLHHLPKTLVVFPPGRDRAAPLWEEF